MKIKNILQSHEVSLLKFSNLLNISRPTLNSYILLFENGKKIPNDKIQLIFNKLFDQELAHHEFITILKKYSRMLKRDEAMGILDVDSKVTDLVTSVVDNIKKDCESGDYNENVYEFINMLISNYRNDELFSHLVEYFLVLNGRIPLEEIDFRKKPYLLHYYSVLDKDKHHELSFDQQLYSDFVSRINEIKELRNKETLVQTELMNKIRDRIQEITEYEPEIDKEDLMKLVLTSLQKD